LFELLFDVLEHLLQLLRIHRLAVLGQVVLLDDDLHAIERQLFDSGILVSESYLAHQLVKELVRRDASIFKDSIETPFKGCKHSSFSLLVFVCQELNEMLHLRLLDGLLKQYREEFHHFDCFNEYKHVWVFQHVGDDVEDGRVVFLLHTVFGSALVLLNKLLEFLIECFHRLPFNINLTEVWDLVEVGRH
jgi:hypothetical protein